MELFYYILAAVAVGTVIGVLAHKYLPGSAVGKVAGSVEHYVESEYARVEPKVVAGVENAASAVLSEAGKVAAVVGSATLSGVETTIENALVSEAVSLLTKGMSALLDTSSEDDAILQAENAYKAVLDKANASKAAKAQALATANTTLSATAANAGPAAAKA